MAVATNLDWTEEDRVLPAYIVRNFIAYIHADLGELDLALEHAERNASAADPRSMSSPAKRTSGTPQNGDDFFVYKAIWKPISTSAAFL
ncbi:MAG: hypothetical protein ACM3ZC_14695 [Bacteroidota bacterium]